MRNAVIETLVFGVVLALSLFGSVGTLAWPMAWALIAVYALFSIVGFALLPAELIAERSRLPADARPEDLLIAGLAFLLLYPATAVVSGLDVRWHWSPALPAVVRIAALAMFMLGYAVSFWAAWANPFFSSVVRIQSERGHHVISRGPYALRPPSRLRGTDGRPRLPAARARLALGVAPGAGRMRLPRPADRLRRASAAGRAGGLRRVRPTGTLAAPAVRLVIRLAPPTRRGRLRPPSA